MIKNLLNKYVNWIDSTGWKTFFKIYGLAVLYFFVICLIRSDGLTGLCIITFPFNPLESFIAPFLRILELSHLVFEDRSEDMLTAIYALLLSGVLINIYRLGKKESLFRQRALILSQTIKIGLITYFMIVISFYVYLWVSGQHCSFRSCGFLKGYY